jgi:hypothetical protein
VTDPALVFAGEGRMGSRLVVNFGVFSGREATEAEIYRLAQALLEKIDTVEIVSEQRFAFASDVEATVHQVYVELPSGAEGRENELLNVLQDWAEDTIGERRRITP